MALAVLILSEGFGFPMQRFLALQRKKRLHNKKKVSIPKTRFVLVQGPAEQFQSWLGQIIVYFLSACKLMSLACHTGKSLSEVLIFAEHGENMLCT